MDKIKILLFSEKYIFARGLKDIITDINKNTIVEIAKSLNIAKSALIDNRYDFLLIENIEFNRLFSDNLKRNIEHTKVLVFGKIKTLSQRDYIVYESFPKRITKDDIYEKFSILFSPTDTHQREDTEILSEREKQIVRFVALGYSNKQIAQQLFLSIHTVTTHRKNISKKLGIKTISGITIFAILNGIITINDKRTAD